MNKNFLDQLLDGVEVEWKALGEVAEIRSGWGFPNSYQGKDNGIYPFYKVSDMNTVGNQTEMYLANNYIDDIVLKKLGIKLAPAGTIILPKIGAAVATNKKRILSTPSAYDNNVMGLIPKKEINYRFLFFWMQTIDLINLAHDSGAVPSIRKSEMENLQIPIPPLHIQKEIVRILDAFTALTAELTAELNARKKQYNYYRDQLLTFAEGEVEWKALGEVGEIRMCKRILKSQTASEGEIPFYKIGTFGKNPDAYISRYLFQDYKEKYNYPKIGEILISASGTIGRTVVFDGKDAYFQDSNIVWVENNEKIVLNKFLFYFYQIANWNIAEGGTIQRLYNDNLRKLLIPIPYPNDPEKSLAEQARIVAILDKFDALTHSITEGLPREIELRQKQYEYYRNMLLSFPRKNPLPASPLSGGGANSLPCEGEG